MQQFAIVRYEVGRFTLIVVIIKVSMNIDLFNCVTIRKKNEN
jgi:hypothetical protein